MIAFTFSHPLLINSWYKSQSNNNVNVALSKIHAKEPTRATHVGSNITKQKAGHFNSERILLLQSTGQE